MDQPKYPALFTISSVFRAFGWVTLFWTAAAVIMGVIAVFINGQYLSMAFLVERWLFCTSRQLRVSRFLSISRKIPVPNRSVYPNRHFSSGFLQHDMADRPSSCCSQLNNSFSNHFCNEYGWDNGGRHEYSLPVTTVPCLE